MECTRCRGLMTEDHFFDLEGAYGFMWMKAWRCMNCGHAEDALTAANRRLHEASVLVRASDEPANGNEHMPLQAKTVSRVAA